ncbi:3-oxo-tetronate kinase [Allorhodopirellula solitaria]|uniref:3-oxo-tetronate kinase n=1 Tax=Allorhodopirellula solitaria TaxID=2527987 RepID=A0A5C5XXM5_9BACT|nr:3-oxo-tetronate kinase [Allorhodopirellula solitaria]TWT67251.1 hypothetical protein CA85_21010 [Allorhodopirellula solitaria]
MKSKQLGCIADDYTGATDLSSMLVRTGRRVIQCFGVPDSDQRVGIEEADAVVVALKSRSIDSEQAVKLSLAALEFLQSWGADRFFFKYCSTFDSTEHGNIGQVADGLADELGAESLLFCPGFPENGRTVHCGHLFVDGVPLSESGMRNHPLNPMRDSNLVRVLQAQTPHRVGWRSPRELTGDGEPSRWIVDAVDDDDLRAATDLASEHMLLTGGSAVAGYWADAIGVRRSVSPPDLEPPGSEPPAGSTRPCVILAGSCSEATREQAALFEKKHPALHLVVADSATPESLAEDALRWCSEHWSRSEQGSQPLLISSGSCPQAVEAARQRWGDREAAARTESVFASIATGLRDRGVRRMIIAGGETSGTVVGALGVTAVRIGREIAPGVPWVTSIGDTTMSLALKSGNFGGPRFFFDAMESAP